MKPTQVQFVTVDQLFEDCPLITELFYNSDLSVSFGDACWTLVDQDMFLGLLDDADIELSHDEQTPLDMELKIVYDRLDKLDDLTYISFEG